MRAVIRLPQLLPASCLYEGTGNLANRQYATISVSSFFRWKKELTPIAPRQPVIGENERCLACWPFERGTSFNRAVQAKIPDTLAAEFKLNEEQIKRTLSSVNGWRAFGPWHHTGRWANVCDRLAPSDQDMA
jgi:hypothetical protein